MNIKLVVKRAAKSCISEVEQIQASRVTNNGSKKLGWFTKKEEEEQELDQKQETSAATLDGYLIHNNANYK
jgi:glycerol kinase